ncbi:FAD-dependent oxidoreductase [Streptomyces sp. NBRC 109706]|uniref:FAD-dependent oxidoreductase n=1 Tax=Streptomyces sp. NBRC 109706 TaxID=1550035 RepID=UPI0007811D6D|nr:FAD-dependent oxidoreductase [Streptomyces sp. NBRC 109706]
MARIAVVGSGPSGVYTAQALLDRHPGTELRVDVLDRLPCPYGLVRYGVAPDHQKIKSLQATLRRVLEDPRVRFLGNVSVGAGGVRADRLRALYRAVVYCVGAARDRRLGVPGEELAGSWSATDFVSWYSGHPDAPRLELPRRARAAVVVGAGNVALDVARMLARTAAELRSTDVPPPVLSTLADSAVRSVHLVGRRGPSQARFTTKELRELGTLAEAEVVVEGAELAADPDAAGPAALGPNARRNLAALGAWADAPPCGRPRRIACRFFLRPVELLDDGAGAVRAVRFERTVGTGGGRVRGTGEQVEIEAQLVLRSVGYQGVAPDGLPFDPERGVVPHSAGRVLRGGNVAPGEYVAGWIKRGPTGVIGSNRPCAKETAASVLADLPALPAAPAADPLPALRAAGVDPVEWPGWLGIEAAEAALGRSLSRGSVKIADWPGLLRAAGRAEGRA